MSITFTFTGTDSILRSKYYPPIILDDSEYVLGLINMETYNSFPNVDRTKNKFHFKTGEGEDAHIEIPEGSYEIDDINEYLTNALAKFTKNNHIIKTHAKRRKVLPPVLIMKGNNNTLKTEVKCTLDIDFSRENSIGTLLGFKPRKLQANKTHVSDFPTKILELNALCVECNIVMSSFRNGKQVHVIHEFFPMVPPGYRIVETPASVIYLPINTKQIDEIVLKITDQNGNLVNFRGEVITVRLHLRKV